MYTVSANADGRVSCRKKENQFGSFPFSHEDFGLGILRMSLGMTQNGRRGLIEFPQVVNQRCV
jgi:hypothetical protein